MKLYATIENEKGKTIGIGSNESLKLTAYDGNYKAYEVNIEWTDIGDIALEVGDELLPEFHAEKGAIITTREWRNKPKKDRQKLQGKYGLCDTCGRETPHYAIINKKRVYYCDYCET